MREEQQEEQKQTGPVMIQFIWKCDSVVSAGANQAYRGMGDGKGRGGGGEGGFSHNGSLIAKTTTTTLKPSSFIGIANALANKLVSRHFNEVWLCFYGKVCFQFSHTESRLNDTVLICCLVILL